jgi:predicted chitinase
MFELDKNIAQIKAERDADLHRSANAKASPAPNTVWQSLALAPPGVAQSSASQANDAEFGDMYRGKDNTVRSHLGKEYEVYKAELGPTQFSSQTGGHKFPSLFPLTRDELLKVFTGLAKDLTQQKVAESVVDFYVEKLNQAFRIFKIDTVEAQASFIANAWHESDQFRYLTETMSRVSGNRPHETNPAAVKLDIKWLNEAATGTVTDPNGKKRKVVGYQPGGSIHPLNEPDWQKSFLGRGPIQVTHRHNYVQVIAVMEKRADELRAHAENFARKRRQEGSTNQNEITPRVSLDELELREAIARIKSDPREAANPKYAFMFSAGFMKMPDDEGVRGDVKATRGSVTGWMGTQPADAKANKDLAYWSAYSVLLKKWEADTRDASKFE